MLKLILSAFLLAAVGISAAWAGEPVPGLAVGFGKKNRGGIIEAVGDTTTNERGGAGLVSREAGEHVIQLSSLNRDQLSMLRETGLTVTVSLGRQRMAVELDECDLDDDGNVTVATVHLAAEQRFRVGVETTD